VTLREVVSGTAILHLAAHGGYDPSDPLSSLIALAPGGGEDGKLQTREIFGLPLKGSELVVLSACETNVGEISGGDDVVGLTRAFFFAGAPSVLSSLWSVDDKATEVLMTSFYKHWLEEGMSKAQALQAAQAEVRANPRWASPFFWAAFTLNGHEG
jgi:CHAT domain-containing protein